MRKILTILCLLLLSVFCTPGFCADKLNDSSLYAIISASKKEFNNPKDIIKHISNMESELDNFITKNRSKGENSKLFGTYMQGLHSLSDNFYQVYQDVQYYPNKYGSNVNIKYDGEYGDEYNISFHFIQPKVNTIFIKRDGDYLSFIYDYDYILKNYCPHLNSAWNTYIKYTKEQTEEEGKLYTDYYVDGEEDETYTAMSKNIGKKWIKKLTLFTIFNPGFALNKQIKQNIETEAIRCDFNINLYMVGIITIGLLILLLCGTGLFFVIKFGLVSRSKAFIQNQAAKLKPIMTNTCKTLMGIVTGHKIAFCTVLGIIAIVFAGTTLYKANSLPTCDSKFAEEEVIELFKQSNRIYKENPEDMDSINMVGFSPESYDKEVGKYTCKAQIILQMSTDNPGRWLYYPTAQFTYNAKYEIYKARGENKVKLEIYKEENRSTVY